MPLNNTPHSLGQDLRQIERRIERLEAKYTPGIDVTAQPAIVHPDIYGAPWYGEQVNNGSGVWTTHYTGYWLGAISSAVRVQFLCDMNVGADDISFRLKASLFDLGVPTVKDTSSEQQFITGGVGSIFWVQFNWIHNIDPGPSQSWYIELQSLNATSPFAGSIDVWNPPVFHQARDTIIGATTTGF